MVTFAIGFVILVLTLALICVLCIVAAVFVQIISQDLEWFIGGVGVFFVDKMRPVFDWINELLKGVVDDQ